ncbi:uncharacterized protein LOC106535831 [Austrofundulus limnaeus]|uniref:Uncharacterized protein LOC106535831 n=1 Tax=Austrofundulus limnaeus TaxID=52670 RepID=A0A2I4D836_AUSLI|nr:PREDICTED: uncharacterized protein LOC106535831 [Austrofundulus limnaeus]
MRNLKARLQWTQPAEEAFIHLKQLLARATDLALPDYSLPFHLDVSETNGAVNGILFQKKGGERQILMYASVLLDNTEIRHPPCTQLAAGLAKIIQKTVHIVMGHPLNILTSHNVVAYVNSQIFTMTSLRQQRKSKILGAHNLLFSHEGINMADRMTTGPTHDCMRKVQTEEKIRPDLETEHIPGSEVLYTDGCCFRMEDGNSKSGFAVVRQEGQRIEILQSGKLEGQQSAQKAEIQAVVEALKERAGKEVTLYTDSAYAYGAVHVQLPQWKRAGFLTAGQKPIKHEKLMKELAESLLLPKKVAVVKCKGHDMTGSETAEGNRQADRAAKDAAGYTGARQMVTVEEECQQDILGGSRSPESTREGLSRGKVIVEEKTGCD